MAPEGRRRSARSGPSARKELPGAGLGYGFGPAPHAEPTEDAVGVGLHCAGGDKQSGSYLAVRQTDRDQLEHFELPRRERVDEWLVAGCRTPSRCLKRQQQPPNIAEQRVVL